MDIRKAKEGEAALIARCVIEAMHIRMTPETESLRETMERICAMPDTLYSWRNTLVATVGGAFAGSITSYPGSIYKETRERTFSIAAEMPGTPRSGEMDDETRPGEYYLDSLAVLPAFRGRGLGEELLLQAMEAGEALGFHTAALIVENGADGLVRLYSRCGFSVDKSARSSVRPDMPAGHLWCFGTDYLRMTAPLH